MRFALPVIVAMAVCTYTTAAIAPIITQKYVHLLSIKPAKPMWWRGEK